MQRERVGHHRVGGIAERGGGQGLSPRVDDLRALFPLGLGLAGHGPLHAVGQLDVLQLDQGHLHTPVGGGGVEDFADVQVDRVGLGQGLIQGVLADDLAQRGLAIWPIAARTFSIASTDFTASTTR